MHLSSNIIANVKDELTGFYGDADEAKQILQRPDVKLLLSADWSGPDSDNATTIAASIDELVEGNNAVDLSNVVAIKLVDIYQSSDKFATAVSDANLEFGFLFRFKDGSYALYGFRPSSFGPGVLKLIDTNSSLKEAWDSWYAKNSDNGRWHLIDRKAVMDSDGFYTEYSLYGHDDGRYATVFGDHDIYRPEDEDFDAEFDSEWEAREWFDDYRGPGEELDENLKEGTTITHYQNKRNPHKRVEVHNDGYGHRSLKQYMGYKKGDRISRGDGNPDLIIDKDYRNDLGDRRLHRWRKKNFDDVIGTDYEPMDENLTESSSSNNAAVLLKLKDELFSKFQNDAAKIINNHLIPEVTDYDQIYKDKTFRNDTFKYTSEHNPEKAKSGQKDTYKVLQQYLNTLKTTKDRKEVIGIIGNLVNSSALANSTGVRKLTKLVREYINASMTGGLTESYEGQDADFTVDLVEFLDDNLENYNVLETIPVSVDEIVKLYSANGYRNAVKGITKEMVADGIGPNWTIAYLIKGVADRKAHKPNHRTNYGLGFDNIKVVNDDLFDTNIGTLQKELGKKLLPPKNWTSVREELGDSESLSRMNAGIGNEFVKYLNDKAPNVGAELYDYDDKTFSVEVDGDWKHEHLVCDALMKQFCDENGLKLVDHWTDTEDNVDEDSDAFRGVHYYMVAPKTTTPVNESLTDDVTIKHVDEVFEGMNGNSTDDDIAIFQNIVNKVKKALKAKEQDIAIIMSDDIYLEGGSPLDRDMTLFFKDDYPLVYENVNGTTWVYFPSEEAAKSWWAGYSGQLDESFNTDDDFREYVKNYTDWYDVVKDFIENNYQRAEEIARNMDSSITDDTELDRYDILDIIKNTDDKDELWDWYFDFYADDLADEYDDHKAYERDPYSYYGVSRSDFF